MTRVTLTPDAATYSPSTETRSVACLNCSTPLAGPFCHACGQRDIPPYPSTRELVVDAFWELSGWDGRFVSTVRALVRHPGMLTREFLEGRRARFLSPLRLYLLASLAYFLVAAAAPQLRLKSGGFNVSATTASRPERVANVAERSLEQPETLTPQERAAALKDIERAPALMRPFLRRAVGDPQGFKRGLLETMPKMLFALLPMFAGLVGLFYRGRKYPEHLYFAIHLHAFAFIVLTIAEIAKFPHQLLLAEIIGGLAMCTVPVYATIAFRKVYGGSLGMTLLKEAAIAALYWVVSMVAFVVTIYWVSLL